MSTSQARLIGAWAQIEFPDTDALNDLGIDEISENATDKQVEPVEEDHILANVYQLTDIVQEKDGDFRYSSIRSKAEHEARVQAMIKSNYAEKYQDVEIRGGEVDYDDPEIIHASDLIQGILRQKPKRIFKLKKRVR